MDGSRRGCGGGVFHAAGDDGGDSSGVGEVAGGFVGAFVSGKSIDECVEAGHKMGSMSVQLVGPQYKWPKVQIL